MKRKSITNFILLRTSYYLSSVYKHPIQWGNPVFLSIEPVNYCNLKCPECPTGNGEMTRRHQAIEVDLAINILTQMQDCLCFVNFYFQGEPYLHPEASTMIKHANNLNIYTSTSSNGHYIDESKAEEIVDSGLQKIIISLDGYDQISYEKYRINGCYEKTINAIEHLHKAKDKAKSHSPIIYAQVLILSTTETHLKKIKEQALNAGADKVIFKTAQFYNLQNRNILLPKHGKSRYATEDSVAYTIKGKIQNRCWRAWSNPVVCSSGSVAPCCYDKNATYSYGNIYELPFASIWGLKSRKNFLNQVISDKSKIIMCQNCPEGRSKFP